MTGRDGIFGVQKVVEGVSDYRTAAKMYLAVHALNSNANTLTYERLKAAQTGDLTNWVNQHYDQKRMADAAFELSRRALQGDVELKAINSAVAGMIEVVRNEKYELDTKLRCASALARICICKGAENELPGLKEKAVEALSTLLRSLGTVDEWRRESKISDDFEQPRILYDKQFMARREVAVALALLDQTEVLPALGRMCVISDQQLMRLRIDVKERDRLENDMLRNVDHLVLARALLVKEKHLEVVRDALKRDFFKGMGDEKNLDSASLLALIVMEDKVTLNEGHKWHGKSIENIVAGIKAKNPDSIAVLAHERIRDVADGTGLNLEKPDRANYMKATRTIERSLFMRPTDSLGVHSQRRNRGGNLV